MYNHHRFKGGTQNVSYMFQGVFEGGPSATNFSRGCPKKCILHFGMVPPWKVALKGWYIIYSYIYIYIYMCMIIYDYICYVFMYVTYLLLCGQSDNMNLALNNRFFFAHQPWGPDLAAWPRLGSWHVVEWTMPWHVAGDLVILVSESCQCTDFGTCFFGSSGVKSIEYVGICWVCLKLWVPQNIQWA